MRNRFHICIVLFSILFLAFGSHPLQADDAAKNSANPGIAWTKGPFTATLGNLAEIDIPSGYAFADAAGAKRFLELTHNPPSDAALGLVVPLSQGKDSAQRGNDWFLLFEFDEMGHISDSEKSSLDADKILASLKKSAEDANDYRKEKGWSAYHVTAWQTPPFYDEQTHNLTWATLGNSDDPKEGSSVNYSTRILGRRGAMSVDLVLDPSDLGTVLPLSKAVLSTFHFTEGSRYADFVKGDKVATYGLTALIAGGAAAAAIKSGLFAKLIAGMVALWKVIAVGLAAAWASLKKFFANLKRKVSGEEKAPSVEYPEQRQLESQIKSSDHDPR
jgi:uncharacterized membrane-anchored protein